MGCPWSLTVKSERAVRGRAQNIPNTFNFYTSRPSSNKDQALCQVARMQTDPSRRYATMYLSIFLLSSTALSLHLMAVCKIESMWLFPRLKAFVVSGKRLLL